MAIQTEPVMIMFYLEEIMDKIGNWVPQIFYDLIGRIIPGGLFLMDAFVIFQGRFVVKHPQVFWFWHFLQLPLC
jgi:hypothetical protein